MNQISTQSVEVARVNLQPGDPRSSIWVALWIHHLCLHDQNPCEWPMVANYALVTSHIHTLLDEPLKQAPRVQHPLILLKVRLKPSYNFV